MESQYNSVAEEIQSILHSSILIDGVSSMAVVLAYVAIGVAVIMLLVKTRGPGTLLMVVGAYLGLFFGVLPVFWFSGESSIGASELQVVGIFELAQSLCWLLLGIGALKFATKIKS